MCKKHTILATFSATLQVKPKFYYTNFVTFTETSPRGKSRMQIMKVRDTNHVADFHDLCPQQSPWICRGLCCWQTGLSRTCHRLVGNVSTCRDGLCPRISWFVLHTLPKLHVFVICHRLCLQLSWFVSTTYPHGKVSMKVGIMEFGLYSVNTQICNQTIIYLCHSPKLIIKCWSSYTLHNVLLVTWA